jgi:hypothetical protein
VAACAKSVCSSSLFAPDYRRSGRTGIQGMQIRTSRTTMGPEKNAGQSFKEPDR